jgi:LPXTG-motif cell wall-anchored protein
MSPTKRTRAVSPGVAKKKRVEARHEWGPVHKELVFPLVGGIALVAIIALILVIRKKK